MIVVPSVHVQAAGSEEVAKLLECLQATRALNDRKSMNHLPTQAVAFSLTTTGLAHQANGEASFPIDETENPANRYQSFLLIACTGRIVTHEPIVELICQYRQILNRFSSIWPNVLPRSYLRGRQP